MSHRPNSLAWFKKDKDRDRFYLFAGMGGRAARRKNNKILRWSLAAGTLVAAALATALYFFNRMGR